ncbi:MAG TPA: hypothetical protein VM578_03915 [Candidatus Saccharimonadales bacterium]|nr:hypothetical protein [Candidatus Saccharimonadales bacterium]
MKILIAVLLTSFCVEAQAQIRHDPLNAREVEQMRETAQDPKKRIELLISFSNDRMLAVERLRSTNKPGLDDATKIADLLGDLAVLIDELDDNLSMYNGHSEDLRRSLRHVIDAEARIQQKLKVLDDNASPLQKRRFAAALEDASDSLRTSTESARAMLADQIEKKGEEKNKEKLDRQDAKQTPATQAPAVTGADHQSPPDYTGTGRAGRTPGQGPH